MCWRKREERDGGDREIESDRVREGVVLGKRV